MAIKFVFPSSSVITSQLPHLQQCRAAQARQQFQGFWWSTRPVFKSDGAYDNVSELKKRVMSSTKPQSGPRIDRFLRFSGGAVPDISPKTYKLRPEP